MEYPPTEINALKTETIRLRKLLCDRWALAITEEGQFDYTFGDPATNTDALRVHFSYNTSDPSIDPPWILKLETATERLHINRNLEHLKMIILRKLSSHSYFPQDIPKLCQSILRIYVDVCLHGTDSLIDDSLWNYQKCSQQLLKSRPISSWNPSQILTPALIDAMIRGWLHVLRYEISVYHKHDREVAKQRAKARLQKLRTRIGQLRKHLFEMEQLELEYLNQVKFDLDLARAKDQLYIELNVPYPRHQHSGLTLYLECVFVLQSHLILYPRQFIDSIDGPILSHLSCVQEVDLSENQITFLPTELFQMPNLIRLHLSHNKLKSIPPLSGLKNLLNLNLACNQLTELPEDIGFLEKLEFIDLSFNKLTDLPHSIGNLLSLHRLALSSNSIQAIPWELGKLKDGALQLLQMDSNPIRNCIPPFWTFDIKKCLNLLLSLKHEQFEKLERSCAHDLFSYWKSNPAFTDMIIESEDENSFLCHSLIVLTRCPSLASQIEPNSSPAKIKLGIDSFVCQSFLQYLYCDHFRPSPLQLLVARADSSVEERSAIDNANSQLEQARKLELQYVKNFANSMSMHHLSFICDYVSKIPGAVIVESKFDADMATLFKCTHSLTSQFPPDLALISKDRPNEAIRAHKVILSARSGFFKNMLTGGMVESCMTDIPLEISHQVISIIVEFCYLDDFTIIEPDYVVELLRISQMLGLDKLQEMTESITGYSLDLNNVCSFLREAEERKLKKLAQSCYAFILANWNAICHHPDWQAIPEDVRTKLVLRRNT